MLKSESKRVFSTMSQRVVTLSAFTFCAALRSDNISATETKRTELSQREEGSTGNGEIIPETEPDLELKLSVTE
jgi:hypothetical protein